MSTFKRGTRFWLDVTIRGQRFREPLKTTDWREARELEKQRVTELSRQPSILVSHSKSFGGLTVGQAIENYAEERRAQVSPRMVACWRENARALGAFFGQTKLKNLTPRHLASYQNARTDAGRVPKTVNGELSVLRQVLKHAKLWYRFQEDYRTLKNTKPPVGQALTDEEQRRLFAVALSEPRWVFAYVAAILGFFCGLRATEIKGLQWKHVDWERCRLQVRRSKTPAGWRDPSLNRACLEALSELFKQEQTLGFAKPDDFVFPWHGRNKQLDPTRPMTSWRSAWRSLRKAAGLSHVRFHDGRHTALTRLAEAGQPDWVIQAQIGHVSPAMMKTYSHIRRKALDDAASVLEPNFTLKNEELVGTRPSQEPDEAVASQSASQSADADHESLDLLRKVGSSAWTRTSNPPVNRLMQVMYLVGSSVL